MREVILQLIELKGLKQYNFAKEIGVNPSYLNQLLSPSGGRNIGISIIERIKARYPDFNTNCLFSPDTLIISEKTTETYQKENNNNSKCYRCQELEKMLHDSQETISMLKRVIESNVTIFESLNSQLSKGQENGSKG